jgi:hypothetical protein
MYKAWMPELDDERYVRELFEELYAIQLRKVPESWEKTFDFELLSQRRRVAAVEVKRFGKVPATPEKGWVATDSGFMTRPDNAASRVGAAIHKAYKQLATTKDPRVLVFINDETLMDFFDLKEAMVGYLTYGEGEQRFRNVTGMKIAEGRIREEKRSIDLYVWINRYEGRLPHRMDGLPLEPHAQRGPLFACTTDVGDELATKYFDIPASPKPERNAEEDVPTLSELLRRQAMGR